MRGCPLPRRGKRKSIIRYIFESYRQLSRRRAGPCDSDCPEFLLRGMAELDGPIAGFSAIAMVSTSNRSYDGRSSNVDVLHTPAY